jgi:hypothetical protein
MRFTVKVEWQREDGTVATAELGRLDGAGLHSGTDLGLKSADTKAIFARLQNIIMTIQVRSYRKSFSNCPSCRAPRRIKEYRERRLDSVFGKVFRRAPRFERCRTCDRAGTHSPLSELGVPAASMQFLTLRTVESNVFKQLQRP